MLEQGEERSYVQKVSYATAWPHYLSYNWNIRSPEMNVILCIKSISNYSPFTLHYSCNSFYSYYEIYCHCKIVKNNFYVLDAF